MAVVNEVERLKALRQYRILDTDPEQAFDDLTLIASQICGAPIALITLVDEDRQWFKSRIGVEVQETSRSVSFCAHAIQQKGIFTIPDALNDAHPLLCRGADHDGGWGGARNSLRLGLRPTQAHRRSEQRAHGTQAAGGSAT